MPRNELAELFAWINKAIYASFPEDERVDAFEFAIGYARWWYTLPVVEPNHVYPGQEAK